MTLVGLVGSAGLALGDCAGRGRGGGGSGGVGGVGLWGGEWGGMGRGPK